jgi:hypothetical protein
MKFAGSDPALRLGQRRTWQWSRPLILAARKHFSIA